MLIKSILVYGRKTDSKDVSKDDITGFQDALASCSFEILKEDHDNTRIAAVIEIPQKAQYDYYNIENSINEMNSAFEPQIIGAFDTIERGIPSLDIFNQTYPVKEEEGIDPELATYFYNKKNENKIKLSHTFPKDAPESNYMERYVLHTLENPDEVAFKELERPENAKFHSAVISYKITEIGQLMPLIHQLSKHHIDTTDIFHARINENYCRNIFFAGIKFPSKTIDEIAELHGPLMTFERIFMHETSAESFLNTVSQERYRPTDRSYR